MYQVPAHGQETREIKIDPALLLPTFSPTRQLEKIHSVLLQRDKLGSMSERFMRVDFGSREHF